MNKQNYKTTVYEGRRQILSFLLSKFEKHIGRFTKRMGTLRSAFENADNQWEHIFKCQLESRQRTPINIISQSMFHLNCRVGNGNDDISSEEDFENSKTIRGFYLDL